MQRRDVPSGLELIQERHQGVHQYFVLRDILQRLRWLQLETAQWTAVDLPHTRFATHPGASRASMQDTKRFVANTAIVFFWLFLRAIIGIHFFHTQLTVTTIVFTGTCGDRDAVIVFETQQQRACVVQLFRERVDHELDEQPWLGQHVDDMGICKTAF